MEMAFVDAGTGIAHDIHWRLSPDWLGISLPIEEVMSRTRMRTIMNSELRVFSPQDEVLTLCIEALHDGWTSLSAVRDLAALTSCWDEEAWDHLLERCEGKRLGIAVLLGLAVVRTILDTPLPARVENAIRKHPQLDRLRTLAIHALLRDEPSSQEMDPRALHLHLTACATRVEQMRYLAIRLLAPTARDWERLQLPDPLYPLYFVTRPFRLAGSILRLPRSGSALVLRTKS
jgi:hypothetical protein